jgi:hypothetical protein
MQFHVGPFTYKLVVSDRQIFDSQGNQLEAVAVEGRRLLILSMIVEPERREEVACHELVHAFRFHFPAPKTDEEEAQFIALVAQQFRQDLEAQGGREALEQMPMTRVPHLGRPMPAKLAASSREFFGQADRMECGCCGSETMCGSIANGTPELHEPTGRYRVERWFKCDACNAVQVWLETCAPDGTPLGEFVANPAPRLLRGPEAVRWMADHSELAGT